MTRSFCISLLTFIFLSSCETNSILKDNYNIPEAKWFIKDSPSFTFEVADIQATYNVFYNIRNNRNYLYHNLYLTHYLTAPNGKIVHQHLDEIMLFDPITGKSSGNGLGDIYDHKVLTFKDFKFSRKGKYKMKISQYMRQNPLLDIVSVGFSIEKNK